jgi:2'-5' RNA ligase
LYAVVAFLDSETENVINEVWKELSARQISNYGEEMRNRRAHITIASYTAVPEQKMIDDLTSFYKLAKRIRMDLATLGMFLKSGTLFISPVLTRELLDFHQAHHTAFGSFDDELDSVYHPDNWVPHCTIASRLHGESLAKAFSYCSEKLAPRKAIISELALLKLEYNEGKCVSAPVIWQCKLKSN